MNHPDSSRLTPESPLRLRRKKRRRHKRRRGNHRKRNPTLSETGGLPPKDSGPPESENAKPDQ